MKQLLIIAMLAFGMSATAQTKDSLAKCEMFQSKIWLAGHLVALENAADTPTTPVHKYANYIISEPFGKYWIEQLSVGVVINFPQTDGSCSDSLLLERVRVIFPEYAKRVFPQ